MPPIKGLSLEAVCCQGICSGQTWARLMLTLSALRCWGHWHLSPYLEKRHWLNGKCLPIPMPAQKQTPWGPEGFSLDRNFLLSPTSQSWHSSPKAPIPPLLPTLQDPALGPWWLDVQRPLSGWGPGWHSLAQEMPRNGIKCSAPTCKHVAWQEPHLYPLLKTQAEEQERGGSLANIIRLNRFSGL